MNEFFKKIFTKAAALWAGWSMQQRIISGIVGVILIITIIALFRVSSSPIMINVYDRPITDESLLDRIVWRFNQENARFSVTANNVIQVYDDATARRMRAILISENLIPDRINPWEVFDRERWTNTDMERNINFQRAQERMIADHIRAIEGVDNVELQVVWPRREIFRSEQNPVTAVVTIFPTPGSDITRNRSKVEGIQRILQFAVEGLRAEHITITDQNSFVINNFEDMAPFDRIELIERENQLITRLETEYRKAILRSLQGIFSEDRVKEVNIRFDIDMSKRSSEITEFYPITMQTQTPGVPYRDEVLVPSINRASSVSETFWRGTGYIPEGPAGVEGHVPPSFRDMDNMYGEVTQVTRTHNEEVNQRIIQEESSPQINRVTVSVNIDGTWKWKYDSKGNPIVNPDGSIEREYIPVSPDVLRYAEDLVRGAIGFNSARGDIVVVANIQHDRSREHREEDAAYLRQRQIQTTIIVFIVGLTLILFGFMLFRMISREMERRKRLAEEERARREQMLRESAMAEAEQDGMEVSISLEERTRMELMENAINMAKEHPEDAAQLIRTWLMEE